MEVSKYSFNLFNNDSYYFVWVKKYYMEITMDILVWHYYIEILNTADKFSSIKNSSTFLIA